MTACAVLSLQDLPKKAVGHRLGKRLENSQTYAIDAVGLGVTPVLDPEPVEDYIRMLAGQEAHPSLTKVTVLYCTSLWHFA
jgi:hypothetical protein